MGSEHRTKQGVDNWMCDDVDTPLMSMRGIFSTILCSNSAGMGGPLTSVEMCWYYERGYAEGSMKGIVDKIVESILIHEGRYDVESTL